MTYALIEHGVAKELFGELPEFTPAVMALIHEVDDAVEVGWVEAADGTLAPPTEPEPEPRTVLTPLEFQQRFTTAEKRAIDAAATTSDMVYEVQSAFRSAIEIDLNYSLTQQGLAILVAAGIITEERKAELLVPA